MTEKRWRILFFAEAVTLAHVMRPVMLAQSLSPAHYDIWLACHPRYLQLFEGQLPSHISIHSISSEMFTQRLASGQRVYSHEELEQYVDEDLQVIDKIEPDLIIGDFRLSLAISAPLAKVPYCTITNSYWSPNNDAPPPIPEHPMTKLLGITLAQQLFNIVRPVIFAWHARPINQVRQHHHLSPLGHDLRRTYTWANHVLYADIPGLSSIKTLPQSHHYIGPILWSPPIPLPLWWEQLPQGSPLIYVNLGSSGPSTLLPLILAALGNMPVTVIAATLGKKLDGQLPQNIFTADYLPGDKAAARANLVVCNGGSPATQQALATGTPVLGVASNMDQHMNMVEIARFGAGLLVRSEQITEQTIRDACIKMLNESHYTTKATEVKNLYQHYPAAERFAAVIETLLTQKSAAIQPHP